MNKIHIYIDDEIKKIIKDTQNENNLSSFSKAIEFIVRRYSKTSDSSLQDIYKFISKEISENIKKEIANEVSNNLLGEIKSLKYATNDTNLDTKILVELMNGIYLKEDYGNIPSTNTMPHKAYTMTKDRIETEIAKKHYKKSNTVK